MQDQETPKLYTPPGTVQASMPHEIIALVGAPGSGKSVSSLTFPNRLFGDNDHKVPMGELSIPFWDANWAEKQGLHKYHDKDPANFRDAIRKWMRVNMPQFHPSQTYIHDSWTQHVQMASKQMRLEEERQEKKNKFFFYQELKKYCEEIADIIKSAPCRVVVTFHETPEWIEGDPTGKMKAVQDGQFKDQMFSIYSDVWRCINGARIKTVDKGGKANVTTVEGRFWQVQGDASFDTNANSTLAPILRKHGIKYVQTWINPATNQVLGGWNEIQRIYNEQDLVVKDGILLPPVTT